MKLSEEQKQVMRLMSQALSKLSDVWTDEMGEALSDANLLPLRDLTEASSEYLDFAEQGEIFR